jgi:hypothetical protein
VWLLYGFQQFPVCLEIECKSFTFFSTKMRENEHKKKSQDTQQKPLIGLFQREQNCENLLDLLLVDEMFVGMLLCVIAGIHVSSNKDMVDFVFLFLRVSFGMSSKYVVVYRYVVGEREF